MKITNYKHFLLLFLLKVVPLMNHYFEILIKKYLKSNQLLKGIVKNPEETRK